MNLAEALVKQDKMLKAIIAEQGGRRADAPQFSQPPPVIISSAPRQRVQRRRRFDHRRTFVDLVKHNTPFYLAAPNLPPFVLAVVEDQFRDQRETQREWILEEMLMEPIGQARTHVWLSRRGRRRRQCQIA